MNKIIIGLLLTVWLAPIKDLLGQKNILGKVKHLHENKYEAQIEEGFFEEGTIQEVAIIMCDGAPLIFEVRQEGDAYYTVKNIKGGKKGKKMTDEKTGKNFFESPKWQFNYKNKCTRESKGLNLNLHISCTNFVQKRLIIYDFISLNRDKKNKKSPKIRTAKPLDSKKTILVKSFPRMNPIPDEKMLFIVSYIYKNAGKGKISIVLDEYLKFLGFTGYKNEKRENSSEELKAIDITYEGTEANKNKENFLYLEVTAKEGYLKNDFINKLKSTIYNHLPSGEVDSALVNIDINKAHDPLYIYPSQYKIAYKQLRSPYTVQFLIKATNDGDSESTAKESHLKMYIPEEMSFESVKIDSLRFGGRLVDDYDTTFIKKNRQVNLDIKNISVASINNKKANKKTPEKTEGLIYFSADVKADRDLKKIPFRIENSFVKRPKPKDIEEASTTIKVPYTFGLHPRLLYSHNTVDGFKSFDLDNLTVGIGVISAPKNTGICRIYSELGIDFLYGRSKESLGATVHHSYAINTSTLLRTNVTSFLNIGAGVQLANYDFVEKELDPITNAIGGVKFGLVKRYISLDLKYFHPLKSKFNKRFEVGLVWMIP